MDEKQKSRVIKRYTNRKLYDTEESRYVTLEEISAMVKAGMEVQIVDNRTGADLTEVTLAQILFEEQKKQTTRMPLTVLKDIIRTRGAAIGDFIQRKVTQPVQSLKEEAERTVEEKTRPIRDFFSSAQKALDDIKNKFDERLDNVVETVGSSAKSQVREQLQTLRKRIEELEARFKDQP